MTLDETKMKRLALIKYLYKEGIEQSEKSEPYSSLSLLMFHTAVELFLALAAECAYIEKKEIGFMEYWEELSKRDIKITQKRAMRRFNRARGEFKHSGTTPSPSDIKSFRYNVAIFFEENTKTVFNIEFSDISFIYLVKPEQAKENLKKAEKLAKDGKIRESLVKVAIAFKQIMDERQIKKSIFGYGIPQVKFDKTKYKEELSDFIDDIEKGLSNIRGSIDNVINVMALWMSGINYLQYIKFKRLIPDVIEDEVGRHRILSGISYYIGGESPDKTYEDVRFCIDFVIERDLALQKIGFERE